MSTPDPTPRRRGRVLRTTHSREHAAHCHDCRQRWDAPDALARATQHTETTGHTTSGHYAAGYTYAPSGVSE